MKKTSMIFASVFALAMSLSACSSKKPEAPAETAVQATDMQPTEVAKNQVDLGAASSGRAH